MSEKSNGSSGGIGFTSLLQIVFITLKLIGKIDWSWWWVMSPTWITIAVAILIIVIFVVIKAAIHLFNP
jgi:hypothetical protein